MNKKIKSQELQHIHEVRFIQTDMDVTLTYVDDKLEDVGITDAWETYDLWLHLKGAPCRIVYYELKKKYERDLSENMYEDSWASFEGIKKKIKAEK